ncbi:MAG TPA: hypothetical protein V6C84_08490 [Coleofasciculaceae cyanobacterium]|jgi:hypothetical protein
MSTQSNKEIKPQVSAQVEMLSDSQLDAISGGAVVIGNGGFDVSLTPIRRRVLITN